ncbi:hypothetical protein ABH931_002686 [Streptacidiphilus sp. MAP12-33]
MTRDARPARMSGRGTGCGLRGDLYLAGREKKGGGAGRVRALPARLALFHRRVVAELRKVGRPVGSYRRGCVW